MEEIKKFAVDYLANSSKMYISNNPNITLLDLPSISIKDIALYQIKEISFDEKAPRKEALENVISSMRIEGITFIYLILGTPKGVNFYYGIAKDNTLKNNYNNINIHDIGQYILEPSLKGNFRGSNIYKLSPEDKDNVVETINSMKYSSTIEGVAGTIKNAEKFQGVDRLADTMLGDIFGFMVIAKPIIDDIDKIEKNLYSLYNALLPLSKKNQQSSSSTNDGISNSKTTGNSNTTGNSVTNSTQETFATNTSKTDGNSFSETKGTSSSNTTGSSSNSTNKGGSESTTTGTSNNITKGESKTTGGSKATGTSVSNGTSSSVTESTNRSTSQSDSTTIEFVDKCSQDWLKYLDEVVLPRLDYGKGKGIFATSMFVLSTNRLTLTKLENTIISLFSGETGNKMPLKSFEIKNPILIKDLKNFQLPFGDVGKQLPKNEIISRSAFSQYNLYDTNFYTVGNWITSNELSLIAGLPQKEIVGLTLNEEVEFGLNVNTDIKEDNKIVLGSLIQSGNSIENIDVSIDKSNLDKHIFVTGVTGSGKTTTCQKILIDSQLPFLIIEPAKKEYRTLINRYPDLLVFTLGKDIGTPFRLNPFEFFPHESITSRVDMIKASIEASFDTEAAIPQLIESAIYECYADYGWDISSNENIKFDNPFSNDVYAFPTLSDLMNKIDFVVKNQGFDDKLRDEYIGSIRARLLGLTVGSKGLMLDTPKSVDFRTLLHKKVVFELEEIRNANEKALIMGFILMNLTEAIKSEFDRNPKYKHITLVEEAHRLLSKFVAGDSLNRKQAVETFTDILAEIRKYGESLIIADQIPNKLTPEVLKNTNTKIIHRIFAQDDKDAIGNTIVLNKDQKEFLSKLDTGKAIVFSNGFNHAVQVKIKALTNTTDENIILDKDIQRNIFEFYAENYKSSILVDKSIFENPPTAVEMKHIADISKKFIVNNLLKDFIDSKKVNGNYVYKLQDILKACDVKTIAKIMVFNYYSKLEHHKGKERCLDENLIKEVENFLLEYDLNLSNKKCIQYKDSFTSYN